MKHTLNPHSKRYTTEELLIPRVKKTSKEWSSLSKEELIAVQQKHFNHLTHEEKNEYIRLLREIIVQEEHKERMAHEDALMASNY
jgi:hypothetical protein